VYQGPPQHHTELTNNHGLQAYSQALQGGENTPLNLEMALSLSQAAHSGVVFPQAMTLM